MNGSGQHGGVSGAGGGYVPSQGWEFVPCTRMDRADRGRGRSPLRRISSPPTVFSQLYEPQFGGEGGAGTQLEVLRGQMWPGPETQHQQQQQQPQTQRMRLKKKIEDLQQQHIEDKEGWMREKESLLREVADIQVIGNYLVRMLSDVSHCIFQMYWLIWFPCCKKFCLSLLFMSFFRLVFICCASMQGGENRRILLDLKTVLEEVQLEVKKEEEKRSELQLLYTRDRCSWELEKAELKCRIAQVNHGTYDFEKVPLLSHCFLVFLCVFVPALRFGVNWDYDYATHMIE